MKETAVAIVGAGPFGVSLAAHLRGRGVDVRIFGEPMESWFQMPTGMFLRSFGFASNIDCPQRGFDFPGYLAARGLETFDPCATRDFAEYGVWVQSRVAPELEKVKVASVARADAGFLLSLANGETARARQVVVAVGLGPFKHLPAGLSGFPAQLVSHSFGHSEFSAWAGKDVAVIGAGSSALEAATLMHEQGVRPRLIMRGDAPLIHGQFKRDRPLRERFRSPLSVLGPGRKNWLLETFPHAMHYAPDEGRVQLARAHLGPSGTWWLRDRFVGKVPVLARTSIASARVQQDKMVLRLATRDASGASSEREESFDHVLCGTGFQHDLDKLTLLEPSLRAGLARVSTAPRLSRHFESSQAGLYFIGPISAYSFGPLFRFICGTEHTSPVVARHIAAKQGRLTALLRRMAAPPLPTNP